MAVLLYFRTGISHGLSYASGEFFHPVLVLSKNLGAKLGNLNAYFSSKRSLYQENENLKRELSMREAELINHEILVRENENLKEIFSRAPTGKKFLLAAIISKPNQSPYDTLLIDVGETNGARVGDMVYALGNIPIGRIDSTTPRTAKAILFSSPREKTQVIIPASLGQNAPSDVFWELTGRGGGNFEMTLPRDFILEKENTAVLPGIRPYAVAIVETILSDPRDPWQIALFRSPVNIQALKFVEVELE